MFDVSGIPLFALADRRLAWIEQRQQVLSQNVANADTPGWRARDLKPFASLLGKPPITLAGTEGASLAAGGARDAAGAAAAPGEVAPDGNGVVLDKELLKVAETDTAHELTTGIVQAWIVMFRTAIGR